MSTGSPLLDLPAEIQRMVFAHAFADHRVNIREASSCPDADPVAIASIPATDVIKDIRPVSSVTTDIRRPYIRCHRCDNGIPPTKVKKRCWKCTESARGLLYTSRAVYAACINLHYSTMTVVFLGTYKQAGCTAPHALLRTSLALHSTGRAHLIRNIEIHLAQQPFYDLARFADGAMHNAFPKLVGLKVVIAEMDYRTKYLANAFPTGTSKLHWWLSGRPHKRLMIRELVRLTMGCSGKLKFDIVGDFDAGVVEEMLEVLHGSKEIPEGYDWDAQNDKAFDAWIARHNEKMAWCWQSRETNSSGSFAE